MADPNSDEGLPPGWTVEVRKRKNGKKSDKYYISPSTELKFKSKAEVFRHLDTANKVSIQRISENVVVEKRPAEGLPPGWIKKTRMTTKGDTIRRDPFYIDPVSGYTFRSIRDVDRYLASGKIGRNAFKSKDKAKEDKDDKKEINLPRRASKRLAGIKADPVPEHKTRNQACRSPAKQPGEEETIVISTDNSTNSSPNGPGKQLNALKAGSEIKRKSDNTENRIKLPKLTTPEKRPVKRLAGIKADLVPEQKTRNQARQSRVKQPGKEETITGKDKSTKSSPNGPPKKFKALKEGSEIKCKSDNAGNTIKLPKLGESKDFDGKLNSPEKHPVKNVEVHRSDKDQANGDKVDAKLDSHLDFPLKEILSDPCIAFAIQTLTGATLETLKGPQISSELKKSQPSETSAAAERRGKKINVSRDDLERCNVLTSSEKIALTGTIPVDCDKNPAKKNCLQQKLRSSKRKKNVC